MSVSPRQSRPRAHVILFVTVDRCWLCLREGTSCLSLCTFIDYNQPFYVFYF